MNPNPPVRIPFKYAWVWILAILGLGLMVKPVYRATKIWRSRIFLAQAQKAYEQRKLFEAQDKAFLARQMDPRSVEPLRILARISDEKKDIDSVSFWLMVIASGEATDMDRLSLAESSLRENMIPIAERQLSYLISRPFPPPQVYNLAGLLAVSQKKPSVAREWFERAIAMDPGYDRAQINLARLELFFGLDKKSTREGMNRLLELGGRKDAIGKECLRTIVEYGRNHSAQWPYQPQIAEMLLKHPLFVIQDRILLADWEIKSFPKRKDDLVSMMMGLVVKANPSVKREIGGWFNRMGFYHKTLEAMPLDVKSPEELLLVQIEAMAALKRWRELSDLLARDTVNLHPVLLSLFRGRAALELGDPKMFELSWKQSLRYAQSDPKALEYLVNYISNLGDLKRTAEVYEMLAAIPNYSEEALLSLIRVYEKLGQTDSILNVMKRLSILRPKDLVVMSDLAYLGLLLNDSSVQPFDKAKWAYSNDPDVIPFKVTYALSQLKSGFPGVAYDAVKNIPAKSLTAPGWQAVVAAILYENGKKGEAVSLAHKLDWQNLKTEERELVSGFYKPKSTH